ncbi:MAG: rRNA maturation RNase YbeY [Myxococcota bacterium]|nr:rRNA maturation RNase YbeY [Myxococcota bacterium]
MGVIVSGSEGAAQLSAAERERVTRRAEGILDLTGHAGAELSLRLVADEEMAELNESYRGKAGPTDVLSFSLLEGDHADHRGALLGDVVIAVPVARRQADERAAPLLDELTRLLVHGVLHLLGHDHEEADEAAVMQREEERVLAGLARREGEEPMRGDVGP